MAGELRSRLVLDGEGFLSTLKQAGQGFLSLFKDLQDKPIPLKVDDQPAKQSVEDMRAKVAALRGELEQKFSISTDVKASGVSELAAQFRNSRKALEDLKKDQQDALAAMRTMGQTGSAEYKTVEAAIKQTDASLKQFQSDVKEGSSTAAAHGTSAMGGFFSNLQHQFGHIGEFALGVFGGNLLTRGIDGLVGSVESFFERGEKLVQIDEELELGFRAAGLSVEQTEHQMKSVGEATQKTSDSFNISRSTIKDFTATYLKFGGSVDNIAEKQELIIALAKRAGIGYDQAAKMMSKATDPEIEAQLTRIGIKFEKNATEGERFAHLKEKLAGTIEGMKDLAANTPLGAFERLKVVASRAFDTLAKAVFLVFGSIAQVVAPVVASISGWIEGISKPLLSVIPTIRNYILGFAAALTIVGLALKADAIYTAISTVVKQGYSAVTAFLTSLLPAQAAATEGAAASQGLLNAAMDANPIGLIVLGLAALGAALFAAYQFVPGFREGIESLWESVKNVATILAGVWAQVRPLLEQIGQVILQSVILYFKIMYLEIRTVAEVLWNVLVAAFNAVMQVVTPVANALSELFGPALEWIGSLLGGVSSSTTSVSDAFGVMFNVLSDVASFIANVLSTYLGGLLSILGAIAGFLTDVLVGAIRLLINVLSTVAGWVVGLIQNLFDIRGALGAFGKAVMDAYHAVVDLFHGTGALYDVFLQMKAGLDGNIAGLKSIWASLKQVWELLTDGSFIKAWDLLTSIFGKAGDAAASAAGASYSTGKIAEEFRNATRNITDEFSAQARELKEKGEASKEAVEETNRKIGDAFNAIKTKVNAVINSSPRLKSNLNAYKTDLDDLFKKVVDIRDENLRKVEHEGGGALPTPKPNPKDQADVKTQETKFTDDLRKIYDERRKVLDQIALAGIQDSRQKESVALQQKFDEQLHKTEENLKTLETKIKDALKKGKDGDGTNKTVAKLLLEVSPEIAGDLKLEAGNLTDPDKIKGILTKATKLLQEAINKQRVEEALQLSLKFDLADIENRLKERSDVIKIESETLSKFTVADTQRRGELEREQAQLQYDLTFQQLLQKNGRYLDAYRAWLVAKENLSKADAGTPAFFNAQAEVDRTKIALDAVIQGVQVTDKKIVALTTKLEHDKTAITTKANEDSDVIRIRMVIDGAEREREEKLRQARLTRDKEIEEAGISAQLKAAAERKFQKEKLQIEEEYRRKTDDVFDFNLLVQEAAQRQHEARIEEIFKKRTTAKTEDLQKETSAVVAELKKQIIGYDAYKDKIAEIYRKVSEATEGSRISWEGMAQNMFDSLNEALGKKAQQIITETSGKIKGSNDTIMQALHEQRDANKVIQEQRVILGKKTADRVQEIYAEQAKLSGNTDKKSMDRFQELEKERWDIYTTSNEAQKDALEKTHEASRTGLEREARITAARNELYTQSALQFGATLGLAVANGENVAKAAGKSLLKIAFQLLRSMVPIWIASATGVEIGSKGVVGLVLLPLLVGVINAALSAAESAAAGSFRKGVIGLKSNGHRTSTGGFLIDAHDDESVITAEATRSNTAMLKWINKTGRDAREYYAAMADRNYKRSMTFVSVSGGGSDAALAALHRETVEQNRLLRLHISATGDVVRGTKGVRRAVEENPTIINLDSRRISERLRHQQQREASRG